MNIGERAVRREEKEIMEIGEGSEREREREIR